MSGLTAVMSYRLSNKADTPNWTRTAFFGVDLPASRIFPTNADGLPKDVHGDTQALSLTPHGGPA
jgi:hypothetical protein